jgi:hypothetical protein
MPAVRAVVQHQQRHHLVPLRPHFTSFPRYLIRFPPKEKRLAKIIHLAKYLNQPVQHITSNLLVDWLISYFNTLYNRLIPLSGLL